MFSKLLKRCISGRVSFSTETEPYPLANLSWLEFMNLNIPHWISCEVKVSSKKIKSNLTRTYCIADAKSMDKMISLFILSLNQSVPSTGKPRRKDKDEGRIKRFLVTDQYHQLLLKRQIEKPKAQT